jgi:ankyrin repeat protein
MFLNPVDHSPHVQVEFHAESSIDSFVNVAATYALVSRMQRTMDVALQADNDLIDTLIHYSHNPDGIPALHYAIKMNDEKAVSLLLEHGADPNSCTHYMIDSSNPMFPLDYAALSGNAKIVQLLIDYGADINPLMPSWYYCDDGIHYRGRTSLYFAAMADKEEAVRVLIANGALLQASPQNEYSNDWGSPYRIAAQHGSVRAFSVLLENSPNIASLVSEPIYALHYAASGGSTEIVRLLLERGAYVDTHRGDMTPLMDANGACAELLLNAGANPRAKNAYGWDALYYFSGRRDLVAAKAILKYGVDVNAIRNPTNSETPFLAACDQWHNSANDKEYLHLLLDNGADINARVNGKTALARAKGNPNSELVNWLTAHGAKD